jgi:hypothetical protein
MPGTATTRAPVFDFRFSMVVISRIEQRKRFGRQR